MTNALIRAGGDVEIVPRPPDEQLREATAALRHAARWLEVAPARTAALTLCEYVNEYLADPRWQREESLSRSNRALRSRLDEAGPARGRAQLLCELVDALLLGDEVSQRLEALLLHWEIGPDDEPDRPPRPGRRQPLDGTDEPWTHARAASA